MFCDSLSSCSYSLSETSPQPVRHPLPLVPMTGFAFQGMLRVLLEFVTVTL